MMSLPINAVLNGLKSVFSHRYALGRGLVFPLVLYFITLALLQWLNSSIGAQIVLGIFNLVIYVCISVTTHRIIILPTPSTEKIGLIRFGRREWQFLLALFEVMFYCLPIAIFIFIPVIGEYLATVAGAYIISRMSLIFPSIAIDVPMNPRASWQATSRYQVVMFTVVFVFSLFFTAIEYGFSYIRIPEICISLFSVVTVVFLVGALSEVYKSIMTKIDD